MCVMFTFHTIFILFEYNNIMITHENLLEMWEKDAEMDKANLDTDAMAIAKLHSKYLRIYMDIKSKRIAYVHRLEDLRREKEIYYSGQATAEVYREKPFNTKLKTKAGVDKHVNTDPDVVSLSQKLEYMDVLLEGVQHIIDQIKWRNQAIKNAIEWIKFTSGEL